MLNHAAALSTESSTESRLVSRARHALRTAMLAGSVFAFAAAPAIALEGIDLSEAPKAAAAGECSALVKIKYPFLSCATGEIGQAAADETWDNTRQIPIMSGWTEGDGAFGPDLHQD